MRGPDQAALNKRFFKRGSVENFLESRGEGFRIDIATAQQASPKTGPSSRGARKAGVK